MIITIDGPSGTGKTTIARLVAEKMGFAYFDTGAMYRAFAWYLLSNKIDISDISTIEKRLPQFHFAIQDGSQGKRYFVDHVDVTDLIRSKEITDIVSPVSALKAVRTLLSKTQKEYGKRGNAVFEGRDIGTVIFPEATIKVFLTARPEVRAKRRYKELVAKNPSQQQSEEAILHAITKRDEFDSTREIAPLKCAPDAQVIDTSDLTIDQVVEKILDYIQTKKHP